VLTDDVWGGVASLLDNYVGGVRPNDTAVIAYASDSRDSAAWVSVALEAQAVPVRKVWMSPLRDEGFSERFSAALPAPTELPGRLLILTFERETMSHNNQLRAMLAAFEPEQYLVVRVISAGPELFEQALLPVPDELSARNTTILDRCMETDTLRIEAPAGTALDVRLDSDTYRWVSNRGMPRAGTFVMLPAGEVATYPSKTDGVLVADFALNMNAITDIDVRLHDHPVTVHIEDSKATRFECEDLELSRILDHCFSQPNGTNVGELGFGTNFGVENAVPMNSHINERRPGVHIGFGQHNQHVSVVDYPCELHVDLITRGGKIWTGDNPAPLDLEAIVPSTKPHPEDFHDEDIDDADDLDFDCCGILNRDQLATVPLRPVPIDGADD